MISVGKHARNVSEAIVHAHLIQKQYLVVRSSLSEAENVWFNTEMSPPLESGLEERDPEVEKVMRTFLANVAKFANEARKIAEPTLKEARLKEVATEVKDLLKTTKVALKWLSTHLEVYVKPVARDRAFITKALEEEGLYVTDFEETCQQRRELVFFVKKDPDATQKLRGEDTEPERVNVSLQFELLRRSWENNDFVNMGRSIQNIIAVVPPSELRERIDDIID
eukprot:g2777.t1